MSKAMGQLVQPDGLEIPTGYESGEISDGYHTFNELYEYRMLYNALLFNEWAAQKKFKVHKSHLHSDSEPPFGGGWFIVMAELPTGQISNHYEDQYWDLFQVQETPVAHAWDGHTPEDVAIRLQQLINMHQVTIVGENPRDKIVLQTWRRMAMIEQYGTRAEIKTARTVMRDAEDMENMHVDQIPEAVRQIHEIFFEIKDRYRIEGKAPYGK